jgi:hypothetical protein
MTASGPADPAIADHVRQEIPQGLAASQKTTEAIDPPKLVVAPFRPPASLPRHPRFHVLIFFLLS